MDPVWNHWVRTLEPLLRSGGFPVAMHQQITLGPGRTDIPVMMDGRPGTTTDRLVDLTESELIARFIAEVGLFPSLAGLLGVNPEHCWCALEIPRHQLLPHDAHGKPGDFDLILGNLHPDGSVDLEYIAYVEVKRRKTADEDGSAGSRASGRGTTQARCAVDLGFDQVLLLHMLSRTSSYTGRWAGALALDVHQAALATAGEMVPFREEACWGFAMVGYGHSAGTDPALVGGASLLPVWSSPVRPLRAREDVDARRVALKRGLQRVLGAHQPGSRFFRWCQRCRQLSGRQGPILTCPRCAAR